mgnify:CR=1 FL=1
MKDTIYKEYCTGCGLCHSVLDIELEKNEKGFVSPANRDIERNRHFFQSVCPAGGSYTYKLCSENIWGASEGAYLGWSRDADIRQKASSGGVLTSVCCSLIRHKLVDGVIQVQADAVIPYETKTVISRTEKEIKQCMGSRYAISSPLNNILRMLVPGETYAFVGKPCDVSALRSYLLQDKDAAKQIVYLFSFFCAGVPSNRAQEKLLAALGTNKESCKRLQYRGNGWPGYATAIDDSGKQSSMTYDESWGSILGRDVPQICRFCLDGVGLCADIVCGDAWYLNEDGTPDFSEHEGRNIVIFRTQKGSGLKKGGYLDDVVELSEYELSCGGLDQIQKYQFERKATMISMIAALKIAGKGYPLYHQRLMRKYSENVSFKLVLKRFLGTMLRIFKGRI